MPARTLVYPPLDGSLLYSEILDFHVKHNPTMTIFVSTTSETDDTLIEISAVELARATHRVAHLLCPLEGKLKVGQVVGIMAITDTLMYHTVLMGLIRAGLVPFPISPRLSAAGVASLLQKSGARHLIATHMSLGSLLDAVKAISAIETIEVPEFTLVYPHLGYEAEEHEYTPYPYQRRAADDTVLYLHSSGSTGLPKPIRHTNLGVSLWAGLPCLTVVKSFEPPVRLATMQLPPFHVLAILSKVLPLYSCRSVAFYPPTYCTGLSPSPIIPSPANILEHTRLTRSNAIVIPPTILQTWSIDPSAVDFLKTMLWVGFGGGPMVPGVGDELWSSGVNLTTLYGATELGGVGCTPLEWKNVGSSTTTSDQPSRPWSYFQFNDRMIRKWIPQGDNTFELVFMKCPSHIPAVLNYRDGDSEGYQTSDLFTPHPTIADTWRFVGRRDDVIVHATGEKSVPAPFEDVIAASPLVSGVVMFGERRDQAGVLIELRDQSNKPNEDLRNMLWPVVSRANGAVAAFSRVFKEMMLFANPDKPLPRVAKGSVSRKAALQLYKQEIDELYEAVANTTSPIPNLSPKEFADPSAILTWLQAHIGDIEPQVSVRADQDLFEQGLDSLTATFLRHRIVAAVTIANPSVVPKITQSIIYDHPTLTNLAKFLSQLVSSSDTLQPQQPVSAHITEMISKYRSRSNLSAQKEEKETILLTGSTGALGSNILARLLQNPRVKRVWAIGRGEVKDAIKKQRSAFVAQGLDTGLLDTDKVSFISGILTKRDLGLTESMFEELLHSTTSVIHNAWRLDFNLSLASFEPLLVGTRNLIDFARLGECRFYLSSSISAAQNWDKANGLVPEDVLAHHDVGAGAGYGASKFVAEHLVADSGLEGCSFRIGQICGGKTTGAWSTTDWFPILVKTSITLGMLPDSAGVVSWIRMNEVSDRMVDIVLNYKNRNPAAVVNVVHPSPVPWSLVQSYVADALYETKITRERVPLVSFGEWFAALQAAAKDLSSLKDLPATKMLGFYDRLALSSTLPISEKEESLGLVRFTTSFKLEESIGISDVRKWVGFWKEEGLF